MEIGLTMRNRITDDKSDVATAFTNLSNAWDATHPLRVGSQVRRPGPSPKRKLEDAAPSQKVRGLHPNEFTVPGVIRTAFSCIGKSSIQREGIWPHGGTKKTRALKKNIKEN